MAADPIPLDTYQASLTGADLHWMLRDGRVIALDYPVNPRVRNFAGTRGGGRLQRVIAEGSRSPHWLNGWFPSLDPISLCSLLIERRPRRYIEVGSGNSTMFARRAIETFGLETRIISIDPEPRAEIDALCNEVIRMRFEDVPASLVEEIAADDMLFVDNSHRALQNSDVTVFFLEVLPSLRPGTLYGLHDIFLPDDYPADWLSRHYSEQYMLAAYLLGGGDGDSIVFPVQLRGAAGL